jgi:hypothetical protein
MRVKPGRRSPLVALLTLVAACSPSAEKSNDLVVGPQVTGDGVVLCADGETCGNDPNEMGDSTNVTTTGDGTVVFGSEDVSNGGGIRLSDKIDLLFVVDNSLTMGDKQQIFSLAVPDLLERLVNPPCLNTALTESIQPVTPEEQCPVGFGRQFAPLKDIHVGIVTTSMGSHGADTPAERCEEAKNDRAHLVGRLERGLTIPSHRDLGFLAWDPEQRVDPPGSANLPDVQQRFQDMLGTVGEEGCGYESTLESMYRFLMDPAPLGQVERLACNASDPGENCARGSGIDEQLLEQRNAFLRPDSVVAVILLTDEDDCSIRETDIGWWSSDIARGITRPSSACATDPNDPCCYSCSFDTPAGCLPREQDTACCPVGEQGAPCTELDPIMSPREEQENIGQNLRCFDQKRKYGFDYLYPVERYVLGLTSNWLPEGFDEHGEPFLDDAGNVRFLPNPLFSQPIDDLGNVRSKEQVFLVGIVGIPWQDVATDETRDAVGQLDLIPASQFETTRLWERILGSKDDGILPEDPFVRESQLPREGIHPLTSDAIMPPDSAVLNAINGKERTIFDDLQYSCIFPLPQTRSCAPGSTNPACDCREGQFEGNPVCWDAATGTYGTEQRYAKAYPPPRILSVLKGIGTQAVVASICPKNMTDTTARDFGYRPVIGTFVKEAARILIK